MTKTDLKDPNGMISPNLIRYFMQLISSLNPAIKCIDPAVINSGHWSSLPPRQTLLRDTTATLFVLILVKNESLLGGKFWTNLFVCSQGKSAIPFHWGRMGPGSCPRAEAAFETFAIRPIGQAFGDSNS